MGKRGINAQIIDLMAAEEPWRKEGIPLWKQVCTFCEMMPCTSGTQAGKPFSLRGWQKELIRGMYKTDRKGRRIVRQSVISMPRKNGKTTLIAMLALVHLCGPCAEQRGQLYSAAADKNQAGLIFNEMVALVNAVPWLKTRCNVSIFRKQITDEKTLSVYAALASDARKAHGLNPSFIVCDELAQWRSRDLYDNLQTGTGARDAPLTVAIGTQAATDDALFSELIDYGESVNAGKIKDKSFFCRLFSAPLDADPWDERTWAACNPALRDFRSISEMREYAAQARRIPAKESVFRNLYLNQRVDARQHWISLPDWQACADAVDPATLYGRPCYAGLDLSSTQDLTGLVLYFPEDGGALLSYAWLPEHGLAEKSQADRVPYDVWAAQGYLLTTQGRAVDKEAVARTLAQIVSDFDVRGIAFDRWRMADLQTILERDGLDLPLVSWGQGFKDMAGAVDAAEGAILRGAIRHASPVLTWCMSNVVLETDPAGNRKASKAKARDRIDLAVCLIMACGLYARMTEKTSPILDIEKGFAGLLL